MLRIRHALFRPTLLRPATARAALLASAALLVAGLLTPQAASAYVGPGAGLTAIGGTLAFFAAVLLALIGFIWYPAKRMLRGRGADAQAEPGTDAAARDLQDDPQDQALYGGPAAAGVGGTSPNGARAR